MPAAGERIDQCRHGADLSAPGSRRAASAGPGQGCTTRIVTVPDGDIVNDRVVTSAGSYAAAANQSGSWVMQVATFRAAGQ